MKISEINKFGKDLELYETIDYIGKGFPVFLPKGAIMIKKNSKWSWKMYYC